MRHNTGNKREKRGISVNNMIHRRPKTKETPQKETREYQTVHEQKKKERKRPRRAKASAWVITLTLASIRLGHIITLMCVRGRERARERDGGRGREREGKERTSVCPCISPCKGVGPVRLMVS